MPTLKEILDTYFRGVLKKKNFRASSVEACALELLSVKRGIPFTDEPHLVRCFDFRALNDMFISDELRTEWMLLMAEAYDGSLDWSKAKQEKVLEKVVISTVNQLIADLPGLPEEVVAACKAAKTLAEAKTAVNAVESVSDSSSIAAAAARLADYAIESAAHDVEDIAHPICCAAIDVAHAQVRAGIDFPLSDGFVKACTIWLEAATDNYV